MNVYGIAMKMMGRTLGHKTVSYVEIIFRIAQIECHVG